MNSPLTAIALILSVFSHTSGVPINSDQSDTRTTVSVAAHRSPAKQAVRDYAGQAATVASPSASPIPLIAMSPATPANFELPRRNQEVSESSNYVTTPELKLFDLINQEREAVGEQTLTLDPLLIDVARKHSEDMCVRGYFDHYAPAPGPVTPMDRYIAALQARPDYAMVGENIYYRSVTDSDEASAFEAHDAFMHSPGHRANVLQALYTKVGVGIYRNPQTGEFWVTEMFCTVSPPK